MNVFVAGSPHEIKRGTGQVFPAGYQVGTKLVKPKIRVPKRHLPSSLPDGIDSIRISQLIRINTLETVLKGMRLRIRR